MHEPERTIDAAAGAVANDATAAEAEKASRVEVKRADADADVDAADDRLRLAIGRRLRRVEGQVRGIERMVDLGRPTPEVITQVRAATAGLRAVARESLRRHLRQRLRDAGTGEGPDLERAVEELLDDYHKLSR